MELAMNREIIERLDAAKRIGVSFTDSMTLMPSKSVTAVCEVEK
jgi:cobalamin-dependent methionine synthase I